MNQKIKGMINYDRWLQYSKHPKYHNTRIYEKAF